VVDENSRVAVVVAEGAEESMSNMEVVVMVWELA